MLFWCKSSTIDCSSRAQGKPVIAVNIPPDANSSFGNGWGHEQSHDKKLIKPANTKKAWLCRTCPIVQPSEGRSLLNLSQQRSLFNSCSLPFPGFPSWTCCLCNLRQVKHILYACLAQMMTQTPPDTKWTTVIRTLQMALNFQLTQVLWEFKRTFFVKQNSIEMPVLSENCKENPTKCNYCADHCYHFLSQKHSSLELVIT